MAINTYVALTPSITLSSATTTVTLSSIPAGYTDLRLVIVPASSSGTNGIRMRINGDTTAIYSGTYLDGNGTSAASWRDSAATQAQLSYRLGINTTLTQVYTLDFMDYSNTTTNKSVICRYNDAASAAGVSSLLWRSTTAINSLSFNINGFGASTGNFIIGSTFSLYGIAAEGVSPAPKATGGAIYSDSTYYYHAFGASGTFTPLSTISCDVLVVAGGAGAGGASGGGGGGGGGGAGGLLGFNSQSLTATGYTVTVGGGGAAGAANLQGTNGGNSQFGALTACVGGGGGGNYQTSGVENGLSGGSGGGAGQYHSSGHSGGAPTSGQGNYGGPATTPGYTNYGGGSGGGAGAAGQALVSYETNTGGAGSSAYSSWGVATGAGQNVSGTYYFAGGGGAGVHTSNDNSGGLGGGGVGGTTSTTSNSYGKSNTGGGGGHGYNSGAYNGSNGGSGIIIVRYLKV